MAIRPAPLGLVEVRHVRWCVGLVDRLERSVRARLIPRLPDIYPEPDEERADSRSRLDDLSVLMTETTALRLIWSERIASDAEIREACERAGREVSAHNLREAERMLQAAQIAVPLERALAADTDTVRALVADWTADHTALISRGETFQGRPTIPLGEQVIDEIGQTVDRGYRRGLRHEEVARRINERLGVARSRAALIGRDQTNKLNGRLFQQRFTRAGVQRYIWRTSLDERVREAHAANEGQEFRWTDPPPTGHPGEDIQCRCTPEPVL
jgi:SPP1 gp7 family putative phage head morphogenesis protein